ncbi:MAG TPA: lysylphosphatidylglycerol synthase domain-containing protein [Candidatus Acidoferrum sp.]|nr:lysylphosphatidylglycerol synthase domain-containing protein [Candidatus Acidoferrum sp.]
MSRTLARARLPLRILGAILGILLFVYLIHRAGPAKLLASMVALGWGLALVIAWGGVAHILKTWAWRLTLLDGKYQVSFARMLGLRLSSEAVGQLGGLAQLFGEGLRVSLLGPAIPLSQGIASVTIDRAFFVVSAAVVSFLGLSAVLMVLPLPHKLVLYAIVFACVLLGFVLLSAIAIRNRWPLFSRTGEVLGRIRYLKPLIDRKRALIHSVEESLLDFYHSTPKAFWASLLLNLACHAAAIVEVYLIVWLMGAKLTLFGGLAIEALTKLVNIAGTFNPGNIGTYEGGNMLIAKMFGLTAAAGLTLAFARRLRALFWTGVGILCLIGLSNRTKREKINETNEDIMQVAFERISSGALESTSSPQRRRSHLAVVLANNPGFGSPLPQVGSVPILLRSILGAAKGGAARIVVVIDRVNRLPVRQELLRTGRVPSHVEWCGVTSEEDSVPSLIGQLASEIDGHLVLIAGDRVYHPSLHKRVAEWDGTQDALALVSDCHMIGMCSLSREASIDLAIHNPTTAGSIEDIEQWMTKTHSVESEAVADEQWQRVLNERQRVLAERKLDGWLVKPTDGIFARANRTISIPISRRIIPFRITPNMVSLFTLGVSFAAGVFLAFGGYWNMLTGAILSWFSSVLDGCDGEVARLKLQESALGCWLETICDNLYYLFILSGMTIGLVRSSGNRSYLIWGGLLLFGAIMSFLMTGLQRHQMTNGQPEQYLREWHKKADSRSSNPLLYLGRHTEFIIRRCFLPYVILFFAFCSVMNWFLVGATVGANIVWIVTLYSYLSFTPTRATALQSPVV